MTDRIIPVGLFCTHCGKGVTWEMLENATEIHASYQAEPGSGWWMNVPCECGSKCFQVGKTLDDLWPKGEVNAGNKHRHNE